ncbi:MAG: hypothetical protein J0H74_30060 [Chitinophagaceae bacterium]|nr:hypothetical protein [Chitinophagaceae bacterium]
MESNLNHEDWVAILNQAYPIEFGWIGVDSSNQVGYFSTFNQAYTPKKAVSSFEMYLELAELINNLPEISSSQLYSKEKGWFHNWHFHSRRGLFGYDYEDAHRKQHEQLNRYDLITVPDTSIDFNLISGIERYKPIIPHFDLVFSGNIPFEDLMKTER